MDEKLKQAITEDMKKLIEKHGLEKLLNIPMQNLIDDAMMYFESALS